MEVDWTKLESGKGHSDARNIPKAIGLLFSVNEKEREIGYWGIDNHAVVQSDLSSSAPYAARLIVDRYLLERRVFRQLLDILHELGNGCNSDLLLEGPLAGESIDTLCRNIVRETKPHLTAQIEDIGQELRDKTIDLIVSLE